MKKFAFIVLCLCMSVAALADEIEITSTQTETGCTLDVVLSADKSYTGFQMDMVIDGEYIFSDASLASPYASFELQSRQLSSGNIRFVAYSDGKNTFASGTSSLLTINLQGNGDAVFQMKNVRFTESDGTEVVIQNVSATLTIAPPPTYTLTFYIDGIQFSTSELSEGDPVEAPEVPELEGYTFSGWGDVPATMPADDVEIYGTYDVNYYTLTFVIDGEEFSNTQVAYGTEITAPDAPEKEGLTFAGWEDLPETMPAHDVVVTGTYSIAEGVGHIQSDSADNAVSWYSLSGIRLNAKPASRGIYIRNRNKILTGN